MNKLYITTFAILALTTTVFAEDFSKLDIKKKCNIKSNSVANILATAKKYNTIAQKKGLEFRRLGVNNSAYISAIEEALKTGSKTVQLIDVKKKKTKDNFTVEYAVQRSCKFAITALTQELEAEKTWRLAVPGDGYKY